MFPPGWSIWCVLLTLPVSACGVEISGYSGDEVICSQGLSECTMKMGYETDLTEADDAVDVLSLTAFPKLCCKDGAPCKICLVLDVEINIRLDMEKDMEDEGHSGLEEEEEDYSEETRNPRASLKMCHYAPLTMPTCKKVEFTVNHTALTQQNQSKLLMVIAEPAGVTFGSHVTIYPSKQSHLRQEVRVFPLDKVCNQVLQERVKECHVPTLTSVINQEMNQLELQSASSNKSLLRVCMQYEGNGNCQEVTVTTPIPLYSVTPCTCFQVWEDDGWERRSKSCPFRKTNFFQRNLWQNVSVIVRHGLMNDHGSMLWWNLSAPCRLDGEVWPCHRGHGCREVEGFRQQLKGAWRQNSRGQWKIEGVFEDINLQLSSCVMMKLQGLEHGPFCVQNTVRWRWSLLAIGVMLLVCLTLLLKCGLQDYVKKWVWSFHHGRFVEIGGNRLVVLLSPPDVDGGVSESVCQLGSMLCTRGFRVSVDQWSIKEQCTLGPLPWLHSQLLELNSQRGRVVLVVTRKALERAEEWTHRHKEDIKTKGQENRGLPLTGSPYSDVFMASLCLIEADRLQGRAGERFLLATFDPHPRSDRNLPELLQGLRLFQLPSQTGALLTELTVGGTGKGSWKRWCLRWMDSRDYRKGRRASYC
ncbi:interleukin-17 receptor C-like [Acanthopagrus latus]|uniref:interleukin-17 receptor C-like n=1 Tax=Acanthopagrus latus TaxID=8177 RepID=UPI00187CD5D9|nr:interleukin-17 receptor C-like [Acanthopagrus latus]XP_036956920.1 interleukin-17 receptor C-like [Acanthopagrus latus]